MDRVCSGIPCGDGVNPKVLRTNAWCSLSESTLPPEVSLSIACLCGTFASWRKLLKVKMFKGAGGRRRGSRIKEVVW